MRASGALLVVLLSIAIADARGQHQSEEDDEAEGSGSAAVAPKDVKARPKWLADKLASIFSSDKGDLAHAKIGIDVVDLSTGDELYAKDADKGMNLASNTKLLTSISALSRLGSGFRWRTVVYADKLDDQTGVVDGDLYVRGRGDPMMSANDLRALAADVAARGVRTVTGRLVVDATYFDDQTEPPHFDEQKDERAGFRAPVGGFGVSRSAVTVVVTAEPGGGATVRLEPDGGDYVRIGKKEVTSVKTGHTRLSIESKPKQGHVEIDVTGQIRAADGDYDVRKRVDDPVKFAAGVFVKALADKGVTIKKGVATGAIKTGAIQIAAHDSITLAQALQVMNKNSDNYIAESVLKTLGAETRATPGPATWADGTAAVKAYLDTIGVKGYRADNGSGLFGASEVSAHQLVTLLRAAHKDFRIFPDLLDSLPIGGVDGTLAKRWHDRPAAGRVRAKTGTLGAVVSLSGYVGVGDDHLIAFAIVVNDIPGGRLKQARGLADDMVDAMVAYLAP